MDHKKLTRLLEVSRVLNATLDTEALLKKIMGEATGVVEAEASSLLLLDEQKNELVFDVALGEKSDRLKEIRLKVGEGVAGWVAATGKVLVVNDVQKDDRFNKKVDKATKFKTRSILCVPIKIRDRIIGVLEVINKKSGQGFTPEDQEILEAFSAQAAISIENSRLFENLTQEKEKIEAIFNGMADGAVTTDRDFRVLISNPSASRLLGMEVGRDFFECIRVFDLSHSRDHVALMDESVFELTRREGKSFYLRVKSTRLRDEGGATAGYIMIFRDITGEKKEEILKRDFLSTVSHKFRTPLVSIIGYVPFLKEKMESDPGSFKALETIESQGIRLSNLVDKLLRFTELESGQIGLTEEKNSMEKIIRSSLEFIAGIFDLGAVTVVIDESVNLLPPFLFDGERIKEVFNNLFENAIKFNTRDDKYISVSVKDQDMFYRFEVQDNGPGIPPEEAEKIFDKFYQVEEFFTGQVEGAGLGLALVKKIIHSHGGRIWVEAGRKAGCCFIFTLPKQC